MSLKYAWNCIGADSGRKQSWPLPLTLKNRRSSWNRLNLWWKYVKICEHYERIIWCWLFELLFRVTLGTFLLYIYIYIPAGTMKFFWSEHVFLVPHPKLCPSFIVVCGFPSLIHWTCPCTRQESNPIIFFWGEVPFCCGYINVIFWWSKHVFIDDQMIAHVFVVNSSSLLFQSFFAGGKTSLLVERHLLLLQFSCKFGSQ